MVYSAWQQRERALGCGDRILPFGAPVHVRSKVFGTGGKYDLDSRWSAGHFVGPSRDVKDGLAARLASGAYVTSVHVRPHLVDADEGERKDNFGLVGEEAKTRRGLEARAENLARDLLRRGSFKICDALSLYEILEGLGQLNTRLTTTATTTSWYAGMYVQGGMAGIRVGSRRTPWSAKYLVEFAKRTTGS